ARWSARPRGSRRAGRAHPHARPGAAGHSTSSAWASFARFWASGFRGAACRAWPAPQCARAEPDRRASCGGGPDEREDYVLTSVRNKSVIVTGGTRGIGKGITEVFAQLGARVCVLGRNEPDGAATVEALRGRGSTAIFCRGDVKEQRDMEEVTATVA